VVHAGATASDDFDQLSAEMDEAKWALEAALRPFVKAPPLGEFLLVRRLIQSAAYRLTRLATRWSRPGYGKIAVYAAAPVSEPTMGDA
jgi:hypothetical protein